MSATASAHASAFVSIAVLCALVIANLITSCTCEDVSDITHLAFLRAGIGVVSTGHCHPRVVEAVRAQAGRIVHPQANVFGGSEPMVQLVDRLVDIMPGHLSRCSRAWRALCAT